MGDLISREELINDMCAMCDQAACDGMGVESTAVCATIIFIQERPTDYDLDKVVEQLAIIEDMSDYQTYKKTIDIVKKGGVE